MLALSKLQTETVAVLNVLAGLVGTDISFFRRLSLNALLTIDVHNRDIINNMIANGIARLDDFEWKRYYIHLQWLIVMLVIKKINYQFVNNRLSH